MDAGAWVAAYAAIVSTAVAVQQWRRDRLRVGVSFATTPGELIIRVANVSNRPIFVDYIGIIGSPRGRHIRVHAIDPRTSWRTAPRPRSSQDSDKNAD